MTQIMSNVSLSQIHPALVHFPIALLLIAPLFVVLGAFQRDTRGRTLLFSALLMMCLGTSGAFLARWSGNAAAHAAAPSAAARLVLQNHEELAETTSIVFAALTIAFAAILGAIWYRNLSACRVLHKVVPLVFLVFYGAGVLLLANTAHLGGQLTHEFGVGLKTPSRDAAVLPAKHDSDGD
jgi:uncharacterized membrane protein